MESRGVACVYNSSFATIVGGSLNFEVDCSLPFDSLATFNISQLYKQII